MNISPSWKNKAGSQEVIQESFPTQAKKEAAAGKPIIHILNPSACWTTTVATTVPPEEQ